jgi:hypothetical protein
MPLIEKLLSVTVFLLAVIKVYHLEGIVSQIIYN